MTADPSSQTLEGRIEITPAPYQKPFVMEYLPQIPYPDGRSPFSDLSIWPIAVRVYVADRVVPHDNHDFLYPTDYGCFSPTLMRYTAEELLGGGESIKFRFGPGSAEFTFTKTEEGYIVSVKKKYSDKLDFNPATLPPVVVPGEVAAYQFAKALSEHYKDMARFKEIELLCHERFTLESVFSDPEIIRLTNIGKVELYNFVGVPEHPDSLRIEVSESDLEKALLLLEEEWKEHMLRKAEPEETVTGASYVYVWDSELLPANTNAEISHLYYLPNNDRIEVHIKPAERDTKKIIHVFVPTGDHLEVLWDQLSEWARKICAQRRFEVGKGHIYFNCCVA